MKEKWRSLKLARKEMNADKKPENRGLLREKGRRVKREKTGRRERNLGMPFWSLEEMK